MKKFGILAAFLTAGSSAALSVAIPEYQASGLPSCTLGPASSRKMDKNGSGNGKFAPKFDGLRFIETLVTAHRELSLVWPHFNAISETKKALNNQKL